MNNKRIITGSLALLLAVSLTVGCSNQSETASGSNVQITQDQVNDLLKSPDKYKGSTVELSGKVFLEPGKMTDKLTNAFVMHVGATNSEIVVDIGDVSTERLTMDTWIQITGTVDGTHKLGDLTQPVIKLKELKKVDGLSIVSPAKSFEDGSTFSKRNISFTINKIDYAKEETRIHLTIKNNRASKIGYNVATVTQDGKQLEETFGSQFKDAVDFKQFLAGGDIQPRSEVSGIMVYPPMDPTLPFKIAFDLYSDVMFDEDNFVFLRPASDSKAGDKGTEDPKQQQETFLEVMEIGIKDIAVCEAGMEQAFDDLKYKDITYKQMKEIYAENTTYYEQALGDMKKAPVPDDTRYKDYHQSVIDVYEDLGDLYKKLGLALGDSEESLDLALLESCLADIEAINQKGREMEDKYDDLKNGGSSSASTSSSTKQSL
ncbi:hypothetical protein OS242_02965 [Tumebacillus sp. DT12]|uniref:DUF1980 domain-containing protein n=1 Tax=Tumebacillus lacus TaxID=2995335 RepID=A0ABT3WW73_9BACL|nr:hypothetical protein [Tumebacillus lacus]MCX7568922.1 hypothetical protein [Tumebacillus lacus]